MTDDDFFDEYPSLIGKESCNCKRLKYCEGDIKSSCLDKQKVKEILYSHMKCRRDKDLCIESVLKELGLSEDTKN